MKKSNMRYAWIKSIPVMCGYLFLGLAFGILLQQAGYSFLWALLISTVVYAGSLQFVLVSFLSGGASLPLVAAMTLLINSRHLFYGLSFVEKFKGMGKKYLYMIFSLTDETYSVFCSMRDQEQKEKNDAMFWIALFDQCYWIIGSVAGALLGQVLPFDFKGIEFAMTALFVVIFLEQWKDFKSHIPAVTGLLSSVLFLVLLGPDRFILPSLITTVAVLMALKPVIQKKMIGLEV